MQGKAASSCCTRGGGGCFVGGRGPPLWSELGDPASFLLLHSMRTDFSLGGNPAANQRSLRNVWLIYSEKSDQTWRLERIYRWTKLYVSNDTIQEALQNLSLIDPGHLHWRHKWLDAIFIFVFFRTAGIVHVRWSVHRSPGLSRSAVSGGCWIRSSLCAPWYRTVSESTRSSQAVRWGYQTVSRRWKWAARSVRGQPYSMNEYEYNMLCARIFMVAFLRYVGQVLCFEFQINPG